MIPIVSLHDKRVLVEIHDQVNGEKQTLVVWFVFKHLFGLQELSQRTDDKKRRGGLQM